MPRGVEVAQAITSGLNAGVNLGAQIRDNRRYEEEKAFRDQEYQRLRREAEKRARQEQILADEQAASFQRRHEDPATRKDMPGYQEDVAADKIMRQVAEAIGPDADGPLGSTLPNIAYLALEQGGTFQQTQGYIDHVARTIKALPDADLRERYLTDQQIELESNALQRETRKFVQDMQAGYTMGRWATPPGLEESASAQPQQGSQSSQGHQSQQSGSQGGGSAPTGGTPQFAQGAPVTQKVQQVVQVAQEALQSAISSGDLGEIQAARGFLRQARASMQQEAENAKIQREMTLQFAGLFQGAEQRHQKVVETGDPEAIARSSRDLAALQEGFLDRVSQGQAAPMDPRMFMGMQPGGQPQPDPGDGPPEGFDVEDASKVLEQRDAEREAAAKDPRVVAEKEKSKADDLEARAAAIEQYDPSGAARLREKAEETRTSKAATKPARDAQQTADLVAAMQDLGVTHDPTSSPASAAMALAELFRAAHQKKSGSKARFKIGKMFNLSIDRLLKSHGATYQGGSVVDRIKAKARNSAKPKYTLDEIIDRHTPFRTFREALAAFEQEQAENAEQPQGAAGE